MFSIKTSSLCEVQQQQKTNYSHTKNKTKTTKFVLINRYQYKKAKESNPTEAETEPDLEVYFNSFKFFRCLRQLTKDIAPFFKDFFQLSFQFFIALSNTENKSMRSSQNIPQCIWKQTWFIQIELIPTHMIDSKLECIPLFTYITTWFLLT